MKILMFLTDFASYKTYLDLKNYLHNNNMFNVELDYYYFNFQFTQVYHINKYNMIPHNHITRYMENDYTDKKYGYSIIYTLFVESFMSILRNYINNKEDLLDINNDKNVWLNHIEWYDEFYKGEMNKDIFNKEMNNIPYADIYLISDRTDIPSSGALSVELALSLYLIRKYNSKVFIGGGVMNEANNTISKLINVVGQEYINSKLEYLVGTIGINIYNYIRGYDYQNTRSHIERNIVDIDIPKYEMETYFNNSFAIELVRGCTQRCTFCCNHAINKYDRVDISIYEKWLNYLNEYYPNSTIYMFAPEVNTNKEYFIKVLNYIIERNIKNKFSFYVNLSKIDEEQIDLLSQINLIELKTSIDHLFDKQSNKIYPQFDILDRNINKLRDILRQKKGKLQLYLVANVPKYHIIDWSTYKNVFQRYFDVLSYSEFYICPSTPYYYNPSEYGLEYVYYQNRYKELDNIKNYINKIPAIYFRNDINRKELVNIKYDILKNMRKELMLELSGALTNIRQINFNFLLALLNQVRTDIEFVDKRDKQIDRYIFNYSTNIGYKFYPNNDTIKKMKDSLKV